MSKSKVSPFLKQCFVTGSVSLNVIGFTCAVGFPGVLLPQLSEPGSAIVLDEVKEQSSWLAAAMSLTVIFGNFISPPIMDRLGRKLAHFIVTLPVLIGWICIVIATNFEMLLLGRLIHGLSFGMCLPLRSTIIGEYTSPKNRGAFLATMALGVAFGLFFVHLLGSVMSWQRTALVCAFFPFTSLILIVYCPESPSFLAARGKYEKCREVFRWLRDNDEEEELEEMIKAQILEKSEHIRSTNRFHQITQVLRKREFVKPVILMMHTFSLDRIAGGMTFPVYSTLIVTKIMGTQVNAFFWMLFFDFERMLFNALAIYFIRRFRRRVVMFSTGSICVIAHLALAGYSYGKTHGIISYGGLWLPVILLSLQTITIAMGMNPLPNIIAGEVFPLTYRSIGMSLSVVPDLIAISFILKTFPGLCDSIGFHGTYLLYAGILTYSLSVIWFLLPETRGKTLQQIEDEMKGKGLAIDEVEVHLNPEKS